MLCRVHRVGMEGRAPPLPLDAALVMSGALPF